MKTPKDNIVVRKLETRLLLTGRVRTTSIITRRGHERQNEAEAVIERKDIPFIKWKKKEIKAVFTDDYIADLLGRAAANRPRRHYSDFLQEGEAGC